jgi:hypothetical protein
LGRFDPQETKSEGPPVGPDEKPSGLPPALGTATQDLRTTVEEKLREIVEAAEARAHEIEDRALEQALEIEQDSEQKARGRYQSSSARAEQMIAAIDAFEREVRDALRALREKGDALAVELGAQPPSAPPEAPEPKAPEDEAPEAKPPARQSPAAEASAAEAPAAEVIAATATEVASAEPAAKPSPTPEAATTDLVREGVRKQILDLFMAGKPRAEAERMLGRIEDGGQYIDLLDEVYEGRAETQQGSSRRRGGRRRRRPGSPE